MKNDLVDLRSDTVTRPTPQMRAVMAAAEVGDDVLGDDPTVIRLQERIAEIMGKPAACFVPSGSMANQAAIRAQTEHGDEIIAHEDSHIIHYETGAPAALSGCMIRPLRGPAGLFDVDDVDGAVRSNNAHTPWSRLLVIENTQNRGGGAIWSMDRVARVSQRARKLGLRIHLDGARLWNACAATGHRPDEYAQHFDTVSCCFSKGLGAPVGSAVCGTVETITRVHRFRKMFGGAMRQSGILAAAALHALEHHRERLVEDHANAARLAEGIGNIRGITIPLRVETNMVFFDLAKNIGTAAAVCEQLKAHHVWMLPTGAQRIRAVCHLDVDRNMVERAIKAVNEVCLARIPAAVAS